MGMVAKFDGQSLKTQRTHRDSRLSPRNDSQLFDSRTTQSQAPAQVKFDEKNVQIDQLQFLVQSCAQTEVQTSSVFVQTDQVQPKEEEQKKDDEDSIMDKESSNDI